MQEAIARGRGLSERNGHGKFPERQYARANRIGGDGTPWQLLAVSGLAAAAIGGIMLAARRRSG